MVLPKDFLVPAGVVATHAQNKQMTLPEELPKPKRIEALQEDTMDIDKSSHSHVIEKDSSAESCSSIIIDAQLAHTTCADGFEDSQEASMHSETGMADSIVNVKTNSSIGIPDCEDHSNEYLANGYPEAAATYFGEFFAHRLRWAHAVNSKRRLRGALATTAHFLEADVAAGPLVPAGRDGREERTMTAAQYQRPPRGKGESTVVCTNDGDSVIMAHYPTERSSDLSLERFMNAILRHNERLASTNETEYDEPTCNGPPRSAFSVNRPANAETLETDSLDGDEAAAFANDLTKELDAHAAINGRMITACVGSRRDRVSLSARRVRKGVKLDFKSFECVEPTITHLRKIDAAKKLGGHLWLNADVFAGPGALLTPFNANQFVRLCAERLPEAVLSLSWGSSIVSTTRLYTDDMIERMIELCMSPIVQHSLLPDGAVVRTFPESKCDKVSSGMGSSSNVNDDVYLTPAATCNHITFAIAADYALASADGLCKLLDSVPGASLTIFSGVGSLGITPAHVQELITTYGKKRCFLDLRVSKPWRSCTQANCCIQ